MVGTWDLPGDNVIEKSINFWASGIEFLKFSGMFNKPASSDMIVSYHFYVWNLI